MKTRFFLLPMIPILILFYLLYQIFQEPDDISNVPHSYIAEIKTFTKKDSENHNHRQYNNGDYHQLIDIDFEFRTLPLTCKYRHPFLLILVHSAPGNFEKRKAIRETWGRSSDKAKLVFLLGSSDNLGTTEKMRQEFNTYSDMVIGSFVDTYKNLTYKHVMGFKYALYHCKEATYVLKTDDDVFVNLPSFVEYMESNVSPYGAEKLIMCNVWHGAHVSRSYKSKYRFSIKEYPSRTFPTYCSGWFILYSNDVVYDLYVRAQNSEYFWVDDVFVTGILAQKSELTHFNIRDFVISKSKMDKIVSGVCDGSSRKFLLGRPNIPADVVRKLWTCAMLNHEEIYS